MIILSVCNEHVLCTFIVVFIVEKSPSLLWTTGEIFARTNLGDFAILLT